MVMAGFQDRVVYLTGASAGLGREMALQLGAAGARLALFSRRAGELEALAAEITAKGGHSPFWAVMDVTDRQAVQAAMARAAAAVGPADCLIANAGVAAPVKAHRFDGARAAMILRTNVEGVIYAVEAVLPAMLARRRGQIVGISSLAASRAFPESHVYCASKSALSAFLEGLRPELMGHGLSVTTVCPGFIRTDMTAANAFPMPFLMEPAPAARKILRGVARRRRVVRFPLALWLIVLASRLIPDRLMAKSFGGRRLTYKRDLL